MALANNEAILQSFLGYPTGWDSYRGMPLRKDVYDLTRSVLKYLHSMDIPDPHIGLGCRGNVLLTWFRNDWEMEIEITSGETVTICQQFTHPNDIVEYEVRRGLPESLLSVTDWFTW